MQLILFILKIKIFLRPSSVFNGKKLRIRPVGLSKDKDKFNYLICKMAQHRKLWRRTSWWHHWVWVPIGNSAM